MRAGLAHARQGFADMQVCAPCARGAVETERTPFVASAVIGSKDDQGIRELAMLLEVGQQAADALVDVLHHRGKGGHAAGEVFAAIGRQAVPRGVWLTRVTVGDGVVRLDRYQRERRQHGVRGDEPEGLHAREAFGAQDIPAPTIRSHVPIDGFLGRLHRKVRGGMREVKEPRLVLGRTSLPQKLEGIIGEDVGDEELAGRIGQLGGRAGGQAPVGGRFPLVVRVRLQVLVTVVGVEAALDGSGRTHVPLADHPRAVAVLLQELGDGDIII